MKRIALVYDRELWIGGVETHLVSLVKRINPEQFTFSIISPISESYQKKAQILGAKIIPIQHFKPIDLGTAIKLSKIFRAEKIDLVHAHSPTAAIQARLAAKLAGLPSIVTVHAPSIYYYGERQTLRARTGRSIYVAIDRLMNFTMTNALIYVSNQVYNIYLSRHWTPVNRSFVIPNGIDLSPYQSDTQRFEIREAQNVPPEVPVITYVGRLSYEKGLETLLHALSVLKDHFPSVFKVWIIGTGQDEYALRSMTNELSLQERVSFLGYHEQVSDYLLASDCFVLPSHHEAMSIAILEAMAAGLPCVVTDVGDNAQLINDGEQGFVILQNSTESLAQLLNRLLLDSDLRQRMGQSARIKAQCFSDLKMVEQIQQLYERLL